MPASRARTTALAAAALVLSLPLSACGGPGNAAGSAPGAGSGSGSRSGEVTTVGSADIRPCGGDELSYSVVHRFPQQRGEHLLITARNADADPCWVTSYPSVMLGDTADVLGRSAKETTGGGTRITVRPGATVHSAVNLLAGSAGTRTSVSLSLALRDQTGDTGPGTEHEALDGKGVPSEFTWSDADVTDWSTVRPYDF
ncbi:DUF4232 domain-containing protein [Streptomyces sp. SP18CS02]|uniref:DUF4232 domain-containing protein n=1 Tax=Streptomyces sp. SP18CS02 TaxID=3002531 RepID=UPI002E77B2E6|nr:DUF4232 domain-containing protein [Streptomyces sp. SP18CS02]MEE1752174.1 DUF4232 domain-containing protein [Streptomyces sp. SP18CS02]